MIKFCLLSCVLSLGQATDRAEWQLTPQLTPGLELVYGGTYVEEKLGPSALHQQQYRLEANLLVLDAGVKDWQGAFMTALSLQDARQPLDKKLTGPTTVRLEQAKIDWQGRARLGDKTLGVPLKGPPIPECGFLVPAPLTKVKKDFTWVVAIAGQPDQRWQVLGVESCGGFICIKVAALQQSEDWDRGRADQTAWRRRDTLWIHPQLLVAQKVERIIEERGAARETPTRRFIVRYDLEDHVKYPDRMFADRRKEFEKARKFQDDAQALIRQPVLNRPQVDSMIQRIAYHLDHQQTTQTTPYRKAIVHVKTVLESAKKGEAPVLHGIEEPIRLPTKKIEEPIAPPTKRLDVGQRAADFSVSSLTDATTARLQSLRGKPVLVFFFNPATPLGKEVLGYAKKLSERQKDHVAIMALAVTQDVDSVRKLHQEMRLTFPVLDGNGMRLTFGAEQTPRFVVLNGAGVVHLAETGWGAHTTYEIEAVLERCQKK